MLWLLGQSVGRRRETCLQDREFSTLYWYCISQTGIKQYPERRLTSYDGSGTEILPTDAHIVNVIF